jgi:hypothetical protein
MEESFREIIILEFHLRSDSFPARLYMLIRMKRTDLEKTI